MNEDEYILSDVTIKILEEGLWEMLAENGEWKLLETLHNFLKWDRRVMIVPRGGFSTHDKVHNMVITWLRARGVLVYSPQSEIMELERSLHEGIREAEGSGWLRRELEQTVFRNS